MSFSHTYTVQEAVVEVVVVVMMMMLIMTAMLCLSETPTRCRRRWWRWSKRG